MRTKQQRLTARRIATSFVTSVNKITICASCGKQPIEWHREEHTIHTNSRISALRTQGCSIERIKMEMDLCVSLCRSCHMKVDGRYEALYKAQPHQKGKVYVMKLPCSICSKEAKPLRKGMCYSCYERHRIGGRNFKHELSDGCCSLW